MNTDGPDNGDNKDKRKAIGLNCMMRRIKRGGEMIVKNDKKERI